MKNSIQFQKITWLFLVMSMVSCLVPDTDDGKAEQFDGSFQNMEEYMGGEIFYMARTMGLQLHDGANPPWLEGTFLAENLEILSSTVEGEWPGESSPAQEFTFQGQNNKLQKINYSCENENEWGEFSGAVISGNGISFTVCMRFVYEKDEYNVVSIGIISGLATPNGIQEFQSAIFTKSTEGTIPQGIFVAEGTGRVVHTTDDLVQRI